MPSHAVFGVIKPVHCIGLLVDMSNVLAIGDRVMFSTAEKCAESRTARKASPNVRNLILNNRSTLRRNDSFYPRADLLRQPQFTAQRPNTVGCALQSRIFLLQILDDLEYLFRAALCLQASGRPRVVSGGPG